MSFTKSLSKSGEFFEVKILDDIDEATSLSYNTVGVAPNSNVKVEYSVSADDKNWSSWRPYTLEALNDSLFNSGSKKMKLRFERTGTSESADIFIKDFVLEATNNDDLTCECDDETYPCCKSVEQNLNPGIIDACIGGFNPLDMSAIYKVQDEFSFMVNSIYGMEVEYIRTEPDVDSSDSVLHEYSVYNAVEKKCIKISVPDNKLPEPRHEYAEWGIDFESFEVHVNGLYFDKMFPGKRPRQNDIIFFSRYNRRYFVNSMYPADLKLEDGSYYKLNLKKYEDTSNIVKEDEIQDHISSLIQDHEEMFGEQIADEVTDVTNPIQTQLPIGNMEDVRQSVNEEIIVNKGDIYNNGTLVADTWYDFSNLTEGSDAVIYRNQSVNENLGISYWLKANEPTFVFADVTATGIAKVNKNTAKVFFSSLNALRTPKYVTSPQYPGQTFFVSSVDNDGLVLRMKNAQEFVNQYATWPKVQFKKRDFLPGIEKGDELRLHHFTDFTRILIDGNSIDLAHGTDMEYAAWNGFIINISKTHKEVSLSRYTLTPDSEDHSRLVNKDEVIQDTSYFITPAAANWKLIASGHNITNVRVWKEMIPRDIHTVILNTKIIRNSSKAEIIDNASDSLNYLVPNSTS